MKLDTEKIRTLKREANLTWDDIARIGGLEHRQTAYDKWARGNPAAAEFFARVFDIEPKDLVKW